MSRTLIQWVFLASILLFSLVFWFFEQGSFAFGKGEASVIAGANAWVSHANVYTSAEYGFSVDEAQAGKFLGDFMCNVHAPKYVRDAQNDQYTFCQNSGRTLKVSLAWKQLELKKEIVLERIANTVSAYSSKDGEYVCREDAGFTSAPGVVSDCVVLMKDGSAYYASAYFFYPDNATGVSHVFYVYSVEEGVPQSEIKEAVRGIAQGIRFGDVEPKTAFHIPPFIAIAHAQDGGGDSGGGDGGGDAGGGCGCDGGGDAGGSTGGGGSPGDSGPGSPGDGSGGGDGGGGSGGGTGTPGGGSGGGVTNQMPFVSAGPDIRLVLPQTSVRITGASAYDPDGPMPTLRWIRSGGPTSLIGGGTSLTPTMSRLVTPGTYIFTLVATDAEGLMSSDSMKIYVSSVDTPIEPDPENPVDPDDPVDPVDPSDPGNPGGPGNDGGSGGGGGGGGGTPGGGDDDDDTSGGPDSPTGPDLRTNETLVHVGSPVILSWDTNNGDEGECTLRGGRLGTSYTPIPLAGDPEIGSITVTVEGRTTYTLTCPDGVDGATIDIIPDIKES